MAKPKLTEETVALFKAYAEDAGNWSGQPLVGGNVGGSLAENGRLTHLKRAGLIKTSQEYGHSWLTFTDAGIEYAKTLGIDLSWIKG